MVVELSALRAPGADAVRILREAVGGRRDDWIGLWRDIVDIDSGPHEIDGIHRVYDRLSYPLQELGLVATRQPSTQGPDVLIARDGAGDVDRLRVLLIGHVDTVFPSPAARVRPFTVTAGRASGPGVADMKGGVVLALAAIGALPTSVRERLAITVLFNGDEESASVGSRAAIEAAAGQADVALVFESGRPDGRIVVGRRGAVRIELSVTGVPAHSGVAPEAGANAAVQAAHHVLAIEEFNRRNDDLSLTVTMLDAGRLPNIVPDAARIHLDGRFDTRDGGRAIGGFVADLVAHTDVARTTTVSRVLNERPAFPVDGVNDALAECYLAGSDALGIAAGTLTTGGSSDGNFAAALGVPTLDGLGPVGDGYHTDDEWSDVESLIDRAAVTAAVLSAAAELSPRSRRR